MSAGQAGEEGREAESKLCALSESGMIKNKINANIQQVCIHSESRFERISRKSNIKVDIYHI